MGKQWEQWQTLFWGLQNHCRWWLQPFKRCLLLERKPMTNLDSILKSRYITLLTKVCLVKAVVFPAVMYGCESWTIRKAEHCRLDAFELWCGIRLLRVSWTARRSKEVHPKGNQSWISIGRTDVEVETPILWLPDVKNWLIGKDPDARKDWRREEKGTTEDEMVGKHHQLDGPEFEWALGVGDQQGSLVCYSPWGHKESDTTEWLNWNWSYPHYIHVITPLRTTISTLWYGNYGTRKLRNFFKVIMNQIHKWTKLSSVLMPHAVPKGTWF